ncbi:hypothetical protein CSQ88_01540 [Iodobacter sp. BJB302]|nr:hypothetical protein CSQ88_01540 [Iodobacter sp. BJB302]
MWCSSYYKKLASALLLMTLASGTFAAGWREELPAATPLGSGEFRWLGFRIYTARLWSEQRPFVASAPFALELTYHRSISRERFVSSSLDEIKRLSSKEYSKAQLARWQAEMERAFSDVESGDQLIGVYLPGVGCRFYGKKGLNAEVADVEFAKAFFAIWLDERSKDSNLRAQLLGQK